MKTRIWHNQFNTTLVQYLSIGEPKVYMFTNIGWIPVGNAPETESEAEQFAVELSESYGLKEGSQDMANYFAGIQND